MQGNGMIPPAPKTPGKDQLDKVASDSNRVVAIIAIVMSALVIAVLAGGGVVFYHLYAQLAATQAQQQQGKKSTCDFYAVIGTSPVVGSGPHKSSPQLIRLIYDSRTTFGKRRCGSLPSPSPDLIRLGKEYGFPINN